MSFMHGTVFEFLRNDKLDANTRHVGPSGPVIATPFQGNIIPQNRLKAQHVLTAQSWKAR